jgi:hypothetical protein
MNKISECYRVLDWLSDMSIPWDNTDYCKIFASFGPPSGLQVSEKLYFIIRKMMIEEQEQQLETLKEEFALITSESIGTP